MNGEAVPPDAPAEELPAWRSGRDWPLRPERQSLGFANNMRSSAGLLRQAPAVRVARATASVIGSARLLADDLEDLLFNFGQVVAHEC